MYLEYMKNMNTFYTLHKLVCEFYIYISIKLFLKLNCLIFTDQKPQFQVL